MACVNRGFISKQLGAETIFELVKNFAAVVDAMLTEYPR